MAEETYPHSIRTSAICSADVDGSLPQACRSGEPILWPVTVMTPGMTTSRRFLAYENSCEAFRYQWLASVNDEQWVTKRRRPVLGINGVPAASGDLVSPIGTDGT